MNEKMPSNQRVEELAQLPSLAEIEKLSEQTLDEVRVKELALNSFVSRQAERLPMIHDESEGSQSDEMESGAETAADAQKQSYVEADLVRARREMVRLNEKASLLREKAL